MSKKKINDGGPATAMTLRDHFASQVIIGYSANVIIMAKAIDGWDGGNGPRPSCIAEFLAGLSYEVADEMIKAREKKS